MTEAKPKPKTSKIIIVGLWSCLAGLVPMFLDSYFAGVYYYRAFPFIFLLLIGLEAFAIIAGIIGFFISLFSKNTKGVVFSMGLSALSFLLLIVGPELITMRFAGRAKTIEARESLISIYNAQENYHKKNGKYAKTFRELGWQPTARTQRYSCFLSNDQVLQTNSHYGPFEPPKGTVPFVGDDQFLILAVGNVDSDPALDVWSINEKKKLKNIVDDILLDDVGPP